MIVRAIKPGYFGEVRRNPGDKFECPAGPLFSDAHRKKNPPGWMEIVSASPEEQAQVDEVRKALGTRLNAPAKQVGTAESLGVSKATPPDSVGKTQTDPKKPETKGATGNKDVLGGGK